jgi:hypothetical protein
LIVAEGTEDPIAVGPNEAVAVDLVIVGVRVTGDVEPFGGHALGVGGQEAGEWLEVARHEDMRG